MLADSSADDSLESKIYTAYKGNPCVWLLNNEGGKGCHSASGTETEILTFLATKEGAVGILRYLKDQTDFDKFVNKAPGPSAPGRLRNILVMESTLALPNLIKAMAIPAERVVGMLILEGSNPSTPFSPAMVISKLFFPHSPWLRKYQELDQTLKVGINGTLTAMDSLIRFGPPLGIFCL